MELGRNIRMRTRVLKFCGERTLGVRPGVMANAGAGTNGRSAAVRRDDKRCAQASPAREHHVGMCSLALQSRHGLRDEGQTGLDLCALVQSLRKGDVVDIEAEGIEAKLVRAKQGFGRAQEMTRIVYEPQPFERYRVAGKDRPNLEVTQQFDAAHKKGSRAWIVCGALWRRRADDDGAQALVRQRKARHESRGTRTDDDRIDGRITCHGLFHSKERGMTASFSNWSFE